MAIKVRATARGFYGGRIREVGDEFSVEKREHVGSWMDVAPEERKPQKAEPKGVKKPEGEQDLA